MNKKIENLTDAEIEDLTIEVLEKYLEETNNKVANDNEKKNKKKFSQVDYLERERRTLLKEIIQESVAEQQAREEENFAKFRDISLNDFEENQKLKKSILSVAPEVVRNKFMLRNRRFSTTTIRDTPTSWRIQRNSRTDWRMSSRPRSLIKHENFTMRIRR